MKFACLAPALAAILVGSVYVSAGSTNVGIFQAQQDIGPDAQPGTALFDPGMKAYRVTSGGASASLLRDALHFVYTRVTGDVTFEAGVRFAGAPAGLRGEALLMVRQNLAPDCAYAAVALHSDGATSLEYRPGPGVAASEFRAAMRSPSRLTITRHGHEFTIYAGNPGEEPAMTGPIIVAMRDPVYLGLAVLSHNQGGPETAVFSGVRLVQSGER